MELTQIEKEPISTDQATNLSISADDDVAKVSAYQNAYVLLKFQQKFRSKIADTISNIFRIVWDAEGGFIMIPFTIWFFHGPYGLMLLLIAGSGEILNGFLKFMTQRPRPFWVIKHLKNITHKWNKSYSFPSGHSQFSATFMCTLLMLFGEYLPWYVMTLMILLPIIVGLSRIYLGVHGIECVICGWIIGVLFSITMCSVFSALFNWFQNIHIISAVIFIVLISVLLPYLLLYTIQKIFPSHNDETFRKWTRTAINNTFKDSDEYNFEELILHPRGINKYDFEIWSFCGGGLGVIILLKMQIVPGFVENMCVVSDNFRDLILTVIVGYSVLFIVLFPIVFVLPSKLRKYNRNTLAIFCRVSGAFLTGIWITCLCPIVSYIIFGFDC